MEITKTADSMVTTLPTTYPVIMAEDAAVLSELSDSVKDKFTRIINLSTEQFFENNGITARFNTLGNTLALVQMYISETQGILKEHNQYKSENVKTACYAKYFDMADRKKLTGFEAFYDLFCQMKTDNHRNVVDAQSSPALAMVPLTDTEYSAGGTYADMLTQSLKDIKDPILLYLSGGLDSELVARFMLDAKIPFTPVCFKWLDESNQVGNKDDIQYAFDFCAEHGLTPIIKEVNIPALWKSAKFALLTDSVKLTSPQLVTHVHMVDLVAKEYPGYAHLLGGEVRYRNNMALADGTMANLAVLTKSSTIASQSISASGPCNATGVGLAIGVEFFANGTWQIRRADGGLTANSTPPVTLVTSGTWYTDATYNRMHSVATLTNGTPWGGGGGVFARGSFNGGSSYWDIAQATDLQSIDGVIFQYNSVRLGSLTLTALGLPNSGSSHLVWVGGGFVADAGSPGPVYTGNGALSNSGVPISYTIKTQVEFTIMTVSGPDVYPDPGTYVTGAVSLSIAMTGTAA